jgi:serine/threonine protein kinase
MSCHPKSRYRSKSVQLPSQSISKYRYRSKSVPSRFANNNILNINLLGIGTYGCVISNPINNINFIIEEYIPYYDIDNNDIGKIYIKKDSINEDEESFYKELYILLKIKKIDPLNYFTVKLKAATKFYGNIIAHEKQLLTYLNVNNNSIINYTFFQIIQENGGVNLNVLKNISYKKFLKFFKNFLQGMIKLYENKLVHSDIKADNILINKNKINLIDFGTAISASVLYNDDEEWRLSAYYCVYPPEFYIASILLKYKNNISSQLDNIIKIMNRKRYFDKMNIPKVTKNLYYSGIKKFIKDIKTRKLTNYNDVFTEKIALQSDIYSLAHIILKFYHIIHDMTEQENIFVRDLYIKCLNANPYDRINIYSLYTLVNNEYNIKNYNNKYI